MPVDEPEAAVGLVGEQKVAVEVGPVGERQADAVPPALAGDSRERLEDRWQESRRNWVPAAMDRQDYRVAVIASARYLPSVASGRWYPSY